VRRLTVLGSTGTIGVNTLDVVARNPGRFQVFALAACSSAERLAAQCRRWRPRYAVLAEQRAAARLAADLAGDCAEVEVLAGPAALEQVAAAPEVDTVMAAIVGAAGLLPTLAAARSGKRVLLANKEALVMSGRLFMEAVRGGGAELLPIDSEHNAIFQCLPGGCAGGLERCGVERILLTGSGGPFRRARPEELERVTPEQACRHPNWSMGPKISVDSATMMNKGLEVIEACWLFATRPSRIEVVIHPQSVIHSMVAYRDGSVLAQLGNPDMRTPIAHALAWPERIDSGVDVLDPPALAALEFEPPEPQRFPCLALGYQAAAAGDGSATVLNAANEVAVAAFLARRIAFPAIARVNAEVLERLAAPDPPDVEAVLALDASARAEAERCVARLGRGR